MGLPGGPPGEEAVERRLQEKTLCLVAGVQGVGIILVGLRRRTPKVAERGNLLALKAPSQAKESVNACGVLLVWKYYYIV